MPLWSGVFRFGTFSCVAWSDSKSISVSCPSSSLRNFKMFFCPIGFFYVLAFPIFYSKIVLLLLYPVVGYILVHSPLFLGRTFFRYLSISSVVSIAWPCIDTIRVSLLLVNIFWFISPTFIDRVLCCFGLFFSFQHILACFSFLDRSKDCRCSFFLTVILANQVLYFCSSSFEEYRFYQRQVSL